jgi:proliferating cell nuclear antigen
MFNSLNGGEDSKVFSCRTASPVEWKAVVSAIKSVVEEATFEITSESLAFRAMDPSHVALVDLVWPSNAFQAFQCDKQSRFALRVEDLVKLIGRSEAKDTVEISSTADDAIMMRLADGYTREFTIHLIESSIGPAPMPKLEFDAKATVTKAIFEKVLSDVSVVSDQVSIQALGDKLTFSGKSDIGDATIDLLKNDAHVLEINTAVESKSTYSVDYLKNFVKAVGDASETLAISFSGRKPILIEARLNNQGTRLQFFLAPRIAD